MRKLALAALLLWTSPVFAQPTEPPPILRLGDAIITGFSGTVQAPPPGAANDRLFINPDGPSARVTRLDTSLPAWDARLLPAPKPFDVRARDVGQVFGIAVDDQSPPNIYLGATSAFGLNIVGRGPNGQPQRRRAGGPGAGWMNGQFGLSLQGDPGSIYRVDGRTGAVSLFTRTTLDGAPNGGAALGNLAYDPATRQLFATDLATGMIHRFAIADGAEAGAPFDHGTTGRQAAGLPAVAFNAAGRVNIASNRFNAEDPATWGFTAPERRVFALAVRENRLFYSARNGATTEAAQIFSVGLGPDGSFGADARLEAEMPTSDGRAPITDIAFAADGAMILAQRAPLAASADFTAFTVPGEPRVYRYVLKGPNDPPSPGRWIAEREIAVGLAGSFRNSNGGVAFGYGYSATGALDRAACDGALWITGQRLRDNPALRARLEPSGPLSVDGLQGAPTTGLPRLGEPPLVSAFVDYDDRPGEAGIAGHIGSVRILTQPCPASPAIASSSTPSSPRYADGPTTSTPPPPPPPPCVGPQCEPCRFGTNPDGSCREPIDLAVKKTAGETKFDEKTATWTVQFTIVVTNTGNPFAPGNSIAVGDPIPAGMTFVSATGPGWTCTAAINCTFAFGGGVFATGATLPPIVVTLTAKEPGTYRNCAVVGIPPGTGFVETTLANNNDCASVDVKYPPNDISVVKTGPQSCNAEDACTFTITVTNNSSWPFNGPVNFSDNAGTPMNIASTTLPCTPPPTAMPFACTGNVSLPAGPSSQSFTIVGVIPSGSLGLDTFALTNCITVESAPPIPGFPTSTLIKNVKACNDYRACGFMCHMVQPQIDQIKIEKTANSAECSPGGLCSYTFTVTNLSTTIPTTTFPVSFIDTMPAGATTFMPPPAPPPWTCLPFGGSPDQIKCLHPPTSIPAGGSLSVTVTFQISPTYKETSIENCSAFFIGNMPAGGQQRRTAASTMDENKLRAYLASRGIQTLRASTPPVLGEDDKSCATVKIVQDEKRPPPPPVCTLPFVPGPVAGQCVCPQGTVQQGQECVKSPPPPPVCAPPFVPGPVAGQCVCAQGTKQRGRECVPTLVCRAPRVANAAGTACVCADGMLPRGNSCVRPPVCKPPAKLNRRGVCECPTDMVARRNTCVPRERPRQDRPRDLDARDIIRVIPQIGIGGDRRGDDGRSRGGGGGSGRGEPRGVR